MEIRCKKCDHLGEAAAVRPVAGGVALTCAHCGHLNRLDVDASPVDAGPAPAPGPAKSPRSNKPELAEEAPKESRTAALLERLVPEPGDGLRCPKCLKLVAADEDNCSRCGLNIDEGARFANGEAPWDRPPRGKEEAFERARVFWDSIEERDDPEMLGSFVELVLEEDLLELGVRRLQRRLMKVPDDEIALEGLQRLAQRMERTIHIARTQAEARAESFTEGVQRFRSRMILWTLAVWAVILVLFSVLFWGNL